MGLHHIPRQHVLLGIVFGHNTGQQIALGRDHLAVLVGILVEQIHVALLHQSTNFLTQPALFFPCHVAIVTIFDVGARHLLALTRHQQILDHVLDLVDGHLFTAHQLHGYLFGYAGAIGQIFYPDSLGGLGYGLNDPHAIKRNSTSISFDHDWFHGFAPDPKEVGLSHACAGGLR